ncbi:predicted protein [Scheffersomyces stipitis CBS 6054]|uniref:TUG ubiquitin-like domain-containing protein n=1 Tax=Scheffersomyces stipitis (strain ATCC 58785 / CBS 6054 / NBRC 10063 / NRRL Y-11545) TaxID=322104 RepID=A3LU13_PICST|nr:predicted protein [Scheffersomyces stipitis CBS 6054]ABN66163.1 predicted protein [Scheffersomyces stipitis CBS 6054]
MSSLSFNVSYNSITKKVTVPRSNTVQQLIAVSLDKFSINSGKYGGQLYHNNKLLESSLSLRLANLINNSKLTLKTTNLAASAQQINVKLMISSDSEGTKQIINKVDSNATLLELLQQFETSENIQLLTKPSQLGILSVTYPSDSYSSTRLGSLVGNVSNVVIRFNYTMGVDTAKLKQQEQQESVKLQLKQQQERIARQREEERAKAQKELELQKQQEQDQALKEEEEEEETPEPTESIIETKEKPSIPSSTINADSILEKESYQFQTPQIEETPLLFVPGNSNSALYENPDEDYEMTVSQAKTYQQLIQNSGKKRKAKQINKPVRLLIRVKFPDRSILQINFVNDVDTIKLGHLVKKIDGLLKPEYINHYNIKAGYPPQTIPLNFENNNTFLVDIPDFQSERIVLIWELSDGAPSKNGPFLNEQLIEDVKTSTDLPEVVLESHRGELPDDAHTKTRTSGQGSEAKSESKGKLVPKWLKFK